jgi:hypothetical protein
MELLYKKRNLIFENVYLVMYKLYFVPF